MIWNQPAALAGLALLAGPLLVHLLARRHAVRVVFPAMRFVPPVRAAAVRLRALSDRALLLLRLAIVSMAVFATAQPLLMTGARKREWNGRVALAVIVDASPSVPVDAAAKLADASVGGVFVLHRFVSPDLRDGVRRATEWLETTPAPERAITIVSDFQRGSIGEADLAGVPATTGISMVRAGRPGALPGSGSSDGWRGARWDAAVALDPESTRVTWTSGGPSTNGGLTVRAGASDQAAAQRAAEAARSFGVPVDDRSRPVEVSFAGADAIVDGPPRTRWIASAAIALHASALLAQTDAQVHVGERDGVMTVKTPLPASSPFAPAVIRAAALAAAPCVIDPEAETASIDDASLRRMERHRRPVAAARPLADESDGRWLWAIALALLIVEELLRRRGVVVRAQETHADAA